MIDWDKEYILTDTYGKEQMRREAKKKKKKITPLAQLRRRCAKLKAENERLKELVDAKDELLVCYRLGKRPTEKLLLKLEKLKGQDNE